MSTKNQPAQVVPFKNDVEYIEAEFHHVRARCARLAVERQIAEHAAEPTTHTVGLKTSTRAVELERQLGLLRETEDTLRADTDDRIAATTVSGKVLGIDGLVASLGLDRHERTVLLVTVLSALQEDTDDALGQVAPRGFCVQATAPETIWMFMGLDFAQRVNARSGFAPTAPLMREGILTISTGQTTTPRDLRTATLEVTQKGFDAVLGLTAKSAGE